MKEKVTKPLAVAMLSGTLLLGSAGIAAANCSAAANCGCNAKNNTVTSIKASQYSIAEWKEVLKQLVKAGVITSEQADQILAEIITTQSDTSIDPLAILRDNGQINSSQYDVFNTFIQKHPTIDQTATQSTDQQTDTNNTTDSK